MLPSFKKIAAGVLSLALAVSLVPFSGAKATWNQIRLIKVAGSPAVYLADSMKRYTFIDSEVYFEWLPNFNGVQTVSTAELNNLQLAGNAFFPAGTLVQFKPVPGVIKAYDPAFNTFVVGKHGQLMRAAGSAGLSALATVFGANWQSMVYTVNDVFLSGYTYGADYTSPMLVDGMFVRRQGDTQVFYIDGTTRRPVDSNGLTANSVQPMRIKTVPANLVDALTTGPAITAADNSLSPLSNQMMSGSGSGSTPVAQQGSLTATLSTDTPASAVIPAGAVRAPFVNFRLTAGSEEARITSITVRRIGAGSPADFSNVYLYRGMDRLTLGRTINNSSNTATFSALNLTIPAGQSVVLSLVADINSSGVSGNVSAFEISTASDIVGPSSINGQFPLRGNLMSFSQATAGELKVNKTGSPQNPKVGDTNVLLSSFRLQAGTQEDQSIRSISVYQAGSIEKSQLLNLKLVQAGNVVATATGVDAQNRVNFNFTTPFAMQRGDSKTFEIRGDIGLQARVNTTIHFYLDQQSDLLSIGQTFGYGVRIDNIDYDSTNTTALNLTGAQLRVNFTGPGATDVPRNRNDVTLYTGTMLAQANLEVRKVNVTFASSTALGTANSTYYTNIKLVNADTGQVLFGPADLPNGTATTASVNLQGPFSFTAGQSINFRITANLNSGIAANSTIKVNLNALPSADVRNLDTGLNVPSGDIVPATALAGNTHTVRASALTVQLANSPSNQSYTRGTLQKDLIGIIFSATNAQPVQLRSLTMQTYIGPSTGALCAAGASVQFNPTTDVVNCAGGAGFTAVSAKDRIALIQLIDQGTGQPIGDAKSVDSGGTLNFINLNLNIPAGSSKTVLARMDISNNAILGSTNQFLSYRISANLEGTGTNYSTVVTATDSEGNTAEVSGPTGSINGTINPTVNPTTAITVIGAGSVSVIGVASDFPSQVVVGGANAVPVANFRFSAVNEDIKISKLKVRIVNDADTAVPENVQSVWLVDGANVYGQGGKGATSGVSINTQGVAKFDGLDIVVPKDGDKSVTVRVNTKTIAGGAFTGSRFRAILIADAANDEEIEAQGVGSGDRFNGTSISGIVGPSGSLTTSPGSTNTVVNFTSASFAGAGTVTILAGQLVDAQASIPVTCNPGNVTSTVSRTITANTGSSITVSNLCTGSTPTFVSVGATVQLTNIPVSTVAPLTVRGNLHKIYRSVPTVTQVPLGGSNVVLTNGNRDIFRFSISADQAGAIAVKRLTFAVTTSAGVTVTNFVIKDVATNSAIAHLTPTPATAAANATTNIAIDLGSSATDDGFNISAGQTKEFVLEGLVTGVTTGSNISTRILGDATAFLILDVDPNTPGNQNGAGAGTVTAVTADADGIGSGTTASRFVWTDLSVFNRSGSPADFNNGFLVRQLPTNPQGLVNN